MSDKVTKLKKADIIGRKIAFVYEAKLKRVDRFQPRLTFVRLDTGVIFNLDALRDPKLGEPLRVCSCGFEKNFASVLSVEKDPNLDSSIKAIVCAEHFEISTAILLENDFVLTIGIGEFDMGCSFRRPSKQFRNYVTIEIAD